MSKHEGVELGIAGGALEDFRSCDDEGFRPSHSGPDFFKEVVR